MGVGLDCCLIPLKFDKLFLIQTVDFFYPLIDDPYLMGKITCANVLSDLFATGVTEVDSLVMINSLSTKMTQQQSDTVMPLIIKGFMNNAKSAGIDVTLRELTLNPWCIIGGIATSVCTKEEYISPLNAEVGDVLIVTKPLGAQLACNAYRWKENPEKWAQLSAAITEEQIDETFDLALKSLIRLNRNAARLMHKYKSHAATDVTGFGLLGHAESLVKYQKNNVKFIIDTLPVFEHSVTIAKTMGSLPKLLKGYSPETSGGILICLNEGSVDAYLKEIKEIDGWNAYTVGRVVEGNRTAEITENVNIIKVNPSNM